MSTTLVDETPGIEQAWAITRGAGAVVAIVDEDIDVHGHPEFAGRVLAGYDEPTLSGPERPWRPHGVKVAGLALAAGRGVSGLAPEALLMPIHVPALGRGVGDPTEAEGLQWAADHGADVICCAWGGGERGGRDPAGRAFLTTRTRAALDHCLTLGRRGKGCIVVYSAGNDGGDIAHNPYASHPGVIAVGACTCHDRRASYSNRGRALWCVFPSNDPQDPIAAGRSYLTTTPPGSFEIGDTFYSSAFGFTSAACAAVAGLCALMVSANPSLTSIAVRELLRRSCVPIDREGGGYSERGHSPLYGYGRPDLLGAVSAAAGAGKR
jgi:subtilisin family serine protease